MYIYLFLQNSGPISNTITLENCQDQCYKNSHCFSWSYHIQSQKCYLKNQDNYLNFVIQEKSTKQNGYVSGVKNCKSMNREIENSDNLKLFIHGHQLKILHANFGKQIHPGIKVSSLTFVTE